MSLCCLFFIISIQTNVLTIKGKETNTTNEYRNYWIPVNSCFTYHSATLYLGPGGQAVQVTPFHFCFKLNLWDHILILNKIFQVFWMKYPTTWLSVKPPSLKWTRLKIQLSQNSSVILTSGNKTWLTLTNETEFTKFSKKMEKLGRTLAVGIWERF